MIKEHLMGKNIQKGLVKRFFIIFILLLVILIILPFIVEQAVMLFSEGLQPGKNSIIVFKPLTLEYGSIYRFIENIKKLINFM